MYPISAKGTIDLIAKLVPNGENWDRTDYYYNEDWQVLEERYGAGQSKDSVAAYGSPRIRLTPRSPGSKTWTFRMSKWSGIRGTDSRPAWASTRTMTGCLAVLA